MPDGPPVPVLEVTAPSDDGVPPDDYLVLKVQGHSRAAAAAERAAAIRGDATLAAIAGAVDMAAAADHVRAAAGFIEEAARSGRPDAAAYQADMLRQARADLRSAAECMAAAGRRACFVGDVDGRRLTAVGAAVRAAAACGRAAAAVEEKSGWVVVRVHSRLEHLCLCVVSVFARLCGIRAARGRLFCRRPWPRR